MTSVSWELQKALYQRLTSDVELTARLGGARIYDDVPRGAALPYVTIGESVIRDWSTGTEDGHEHLITISVWSRANGAREVHALVSEIEGILDNAALTIDGARLVNMRHEFSEVRREADAETTRGLVRLRAVTEPVS